MFTLILAENLRHAMYCAKYLGIRQSDWRYIMMPEDLLGYSPTEKVRVVAYETAPTAMRIAARERGFEIIDV